MNDMVIDFGIVARSGQDPIEFKSGETIFDTGDEGDVAYVVRSGTVEIKFEGVVLDTVEQGSVFGEMALIDPAPRSAAAIAQGDVEVVPIDKRTFLFLVSEAPYFALNVMRLLARRLRKMSD
ncbi:MAG: Crp/Fnr family transcriptional regulator [Alphaproteobacteria bacterium]